jgi:hypothetical protein
MRASIIMLALFGCTPDIASGSYVCGTDQSCPDGQSCDGVDGTCVLTNTERPFACESEREHEPDNTPAQGLAIANLSCVSAPYIDNGCLAAADDQDWVRFNVPASCAAVQVEARLTFPVSWEEVGLELWDLTSMTVVASGAACKTGVSLGEVSSCITSPVSLGGMYGFKVKPAGGGDCAGKCNYNRYQLTVQLSTPG